ATGQIPLQQTNQGVQFAFPTATKYLLLSKAK
ncbi:MAG: hypothetical protein RLZZ490_2489, partial [Cyanobacteriota bacterium]